MFRITSQLCEVFDCTDQELLESGLLGQLTLGSRRTRISMSAIASNTAKGSMARSL